MTQSEVGIVLRHNQSVRLPARCACCLAPATSTSMEWVQLGGGLRRQFSLPECAVCRRRKTLGLVLGAVALLGSGALGLALGAMLFPHGVMRVLVAVIAVAAGMTLFAIARRLTHPKGHAPSCSAIARAIVDPMRGPTQDVVIHFHNAEFAKLWLDANAGSLSAGGAQ